ncbi:hypothetical protein ACP179_23850 (plasmid) [Xenorhabdus stockiae]|uniref:hypothetical protein n=1 Tax=Xenorhabdus stockiae TaxID=351614 RepID=UPI003CF89D4C
MFFNHRDDQKQDSLLNAAKSSLSIRLAAASAKKNMPLKTSASNTSPKVTISNSIDFLNSIEKF